MCNFKFLFNLHIRYVLSKHSFYVLYDEHVHTFLKFICYISLFGCHLTGQQALNAFCFVLIFSLLLKVLQL